MKKRIFSIVLAMLLTLSIFSLASCTDSGEKNGTTAPATTAGSTTTAALQPLKVATSADFDPFEFKENGEYKGCDIDIINEIAKRAGYTLEIQDMEFDGIIAAVQSGTANIGISALTITPKRQTSVDFSEPYYTTYQVIITLKDDTKFTGTDKAALETQLKGKKIGVCSGYTGKSYVEGDSEMGLPGIPNTKPTVFDNISLAITALKNGSIDCVIMDDIASKQAASAAGNTNVKVIDVPLTVEDYAIAIKKGDTATKAKIDNAIKAMKTDKTLDGFLTKWELI